MAAQPRYQLVEIVDDGLPVWIGMQRVGEPYIDLAWEHRYAVDNAFTRFLRGLEGKPQARVILGNGAPLTWPTARALMLFYRDRVATMAGSNGPPDWALWLPVNRGGYHATHKRPCVRVKGDVAEGFASVEEAARMVGASMDGIAERIDGGHRDRHGWAWFDGVPKMK